MGGLADGYRWRRPEPADAQAIADLINACDLAEEAEADTTAADVALSWQKPGFDLQQDAWMVETPAGDIAGYEELWNRYGYVHLGGDGYVHPAHRGQGIGTFLLNNLESRARQWLPLAAEGETVMLRNGVSGADRAGQELHLAEGYRPVRYFWRMEIEMDAPPPDPVWPLGVTTRGVVLGEDDRRVFEALEEAFQDHWGSAPWDYETWRLHNFSDDRFDPELWLLAEENGAIAGAMIGNYRGEIGWVSQLAVRRPWRRRGLGLALLVHALGTFYNRGTQRVGLGVDSENPTGATRLYRKAGMQMTREIILFEKQLRSG